MERNVMQAAALKEPTFNPRPAQASQHKSRDDLLLLATHRFCDVDAHDRLSQDQFKEAFYLLIGEANSSTKQVMARSLAGCVYTPRPIALYFALEPLEISEPILLRSTVLGQLDFLQIMDVKGVGYATTIAKRPDIGPSVIRRLKEFTDDVVDTALKTNQALVEAKPQLSADELFKQISQRHLAEIRTPEIEIQEGGEVTKTTSAAENALLAAAARGGRLSVIEKTSPSEKLPARQFDFGAAMEQMAKTKSHQGMAVLMQKRFGVSLQTAQQVLTDKSGDPLAVVLKAADTPPAQANRILMLSLPSVGLSTQNATRAINLYSRLQQITCLEAVDQWPKNEESLATTEHQSYYSESRPARSAPERHSPVLDRGFDERNSATG